MVIKDRLGHLKKLIKTSLINFPYHNTTPVGKYLPRGRKPPSYQDLLRNFDKRHGGLCPHLTVPFRLLLESHGFETQLISGSFVHALADYPITHFLTTVKIPDEGERALGSRRDKTYLVDIAGACPLHEPVDLDDLPFVRRAGGLQYRIERINDTFLQRANENGDTLVGAKPTTYQSPQDCRIDLTPRQFSEFVPGLEAAYTKYESSYLHRSLFCFRYLDITADDFEIVCVHGTSLVFVTKETRSVQIFENYEQLKPMVIKYFPMIDPEDIALSMKHFSVPLEEAIKM